MMTNLNMNSKSDDMCLWISDITVVDRKNVGAEM